MKTTKAIIRYNQLKETALQVSKEYRGGKFTRISKESFMFKAESHIRQWIERYVRDLPSKGKTIK
jgi:hypothetical protein